MYIIIKGNNKHQKMGLTRSQHEEQLRKEWGKTMTDEQLDKLKYLEKKQEEKTGSKKNFNTMIDVDKIDEAPVFDDIHSMPPNKRYDINYNKIDWSK